MEKITRFNNRIRQVVLLVIILLLAFLIIKELYVFVPGFLGAVTLYILTRGSYLRLVNNRKWSRQWTAVLFIVLSLIGILLPMYLTVKVMMPRVSEVFTHSEELMKGLNAFSDRVYAYTGTQLMTKENIVALEKMIANFIPTFLNSTLNIVGNLAMMFFVVYFMYAHGEEMEESIRKFIPLHEDSVEKLAHETNNMVRANAIGIPLISVIQGLFATLGYWIFGLSEWGLWGFLTGIFAFFPVIGTMLIWAPLVIFLYAQDATWQATGLLLYSLIVTGNVDYLSRITLMRKIGDVHPLVTILGIIVGLALFGFMGFIFGPLLLSYLILLIKIYTSEFVEHTDHSHPNELHEPGEGHKSTEVS
jgi:predicted PurR-regulated permease PerM